MSRRRLPKAKERQQFDAKAAGARCSLCPLSRTCRPVKPRIQPGAKLTIVEGWPARSEDERGEPTRHPASELLRKNLAAANVDEYSYTWALLCRPPKGTSKQDVATAIECCAPRLASDVLAGASGEGDGAGERKWLISLGQEAFKATTGKLANLDAWIGAPIGTHWSGVRAIPTWSPGWILKPDGSAYAGVWGSHVWRAAYLSDGRLGDFDWGEIVVEDVTPALERIASRVDAGEPYATDIEADGLGLEANITCIGFAVRGLAVSVELPFKSPRIEALVRFILAHGKMITQNGAAYDRLMLGRDGFELTPDYEDCLLAASILDPQLPKNLGFLTSSEFSAEAHKANFRADRETGIVANLWGATDPETVRKRLVYNAEDCVVTSLVWPVQEQRLADYGLDFYLKLKRKAPIANAMRYRGMRFDYRYQAKMRAYHEGKRDKIAAQMRSKLGPEFNPGSTKQVGKLFYQTCNIAPFAWTPEGNPSTDEDVIVEILKCDNPFAVECAAKILEYRNHDKMLGTYVLGGAPVDNSGLVFGDWKCHTAVSGRWSCTKYKLPNGKKAGMPFQVIPARIRRLFRAREGMVFCEGDYNALEIRTLALLSGARHMLQMLADGVDLHLTNARQMFKDPTIQKKSPLRQAAKVIAFSSHYGAGPDTVWRAMVADEDIMKKWPHLTVRQVQAMQNLYFKIHDDVPRWWARNVEEAKARGYYLEPVFGRRLRFYGQPDFSLAQNFSNQSLALEIVDGALVKVFDELQEPEGVVAQIHDSLGLEGPDGDRLKSLLQKHMPTTLTYEGRTMSFPIECKVSERYVWVK